MLIALDFDGTIAQYDEYKGADVVGDPIPGALEFIRLLKQLGHDIAIFSARSSSPIGKKAIEDWVLRYNLEDIIEFITSVKHPQFDILIDDRAIAFTGNYKEVLKSVIRRT